MLSKRHGDEAFSLPPGVVIPDLILNPMASLASPVVVLHIVVGALLFSLIIPLLLGLATRTMFTPSPETMGKLRKFASFALALSCACAFLGFGIEKGRGDDVSSLFPQREGDASTGAGEGEGSHASPYSTDFSAAFSGHGLLSIVGTLFLAAWLAALQPNRILPPAAKPLLLGALVVAIPVMIVSSINTSLYLCTPALSGVDQCVGHYSPGVGLIYIGIYFLFGTRSLDAPGPGQRLADTRVATDYAFALRENILYLILASGVLLYSAATEFPWTYMNARHHVISGAILFVVASWSVWAIRAARTANRPLPALVYRGGSTALAGFLGTIIFAMHMQINTYARVTHYTFAATLTITSCLRLAAFWIPTSFGFVFSGLIFISSQRGFALLWETFYSQSMSVTAVVAFVVIIGVAIEASAYAWVRFFLDPYLAPSSSTPSTSSSSAKAGRRHARGSSGDTVYLGDEESDDSFGDGTFDTRV
jgi:hypothetical protein